MSITHRSLAALLLSGAALLLLQACGPVHSVTVGRGGPPDPEIHDGRGHGPPPHAPAHGYRRKQEHAYRSGGEVEIVFDSGLGVYTVIDLPDIYFWNGVYLRIRGGTWSSCAVLDGDWLPYSVTSVPTELRAKYAKADKKSPGKGKSKGKGKAPAKRSDQ